MNCSTPVLARARLLALSATVVVALSTPPVSAQTAVPYGPEVNQVMAEKIATSAVSYAKEHHWRLSIAVVDTHGFLVHFTRMDDNQTAGPNIAVEKARTAAMFRRPSRVFEEGLTKRLAYLSLPGATAVTGGVPIVVDGQIIGGVGASGAASEDDEQAVLAGLRALVK